MNDMKKRLIELLEDTLKEWECDVQPETLSETAEHLIENGVIVPPCKEGDTVYVIPTKENGLSEITEMRTLGFSISALYNTVNLADEKNKLYQPSFERFGKTVFHTREEAEKALKERENNG